MARSHYQFKKRQKEIAKKKKKEQKRQRKLNKNNPDSQANLESPEDSEAPQ